MATRNKMPLKLDVKKILHGKSERVKCVDIHPKEPWILSALYSGNIFIWNFDTETIVRTFEVSEVPVRTAKFIVRKNWLVCGTDDMHIRIYNYNTCEKIKAFEAHTDYIRSIVVHPTLPFILSASDDMSIKLWDWDNGWENAIIFEGHTHYVMQIAINPKDSNSFASASLDRSVKVWGLNSSVPHFQLEGHDRGVNCLAYYSGGERPFLVSGADDNLVKIWDYQTKTCIATLEGHTANITAVMFHPQLPIIISGSEDGSLKIWHSNTYRLETTLHYAMERVWTMSAHMQYGGEVTSNKVAIGFDEGTILISLGQEEPIVSMDQSGKVVWAKNHEIHDFKQSEIAKLKEKNNNFEKEKANITNQYERIVNEAINNQQNQKKQFDDENNALKQQMNAMREESETEKQELRNEIKNLEQQLNKLKSEINNLLDDKKEMEFEMNELREENERLNGNNLDYALWRQWDSKKVFYFIMNAVNDGSLKPYQESIKKEIFESQYNGKDLAEIDKNELKTMGIKNISIRRAVFNEIQKLIQNKPQMNEGIVPKAPTAYM